MQASAPTTLRIDPDRLRCLRVRRALTQLALAEAAGIRRATVSNLERGTQPARLTTIRAIAAALAVDPLDLADEAP